MTKIIVSTVVCLFVLCRVADAQNGGTYGSVPNIMTPEAATLGKFGAYPVSYYTGAINVSVPLYTIKENDISLDVSLQNSSSGFIPNMEDGIVGLNWNLIAGGVITRQVNWAPDDQDMANDGTYGFNSNIGYIYGILQAKDQTFAKDYLTNLQFLGYTPGMVTTTVPYELAPDVFSFNFNGHNGRFFLGNDGVVKVSADHNYKVDLSGMSGQNNLCQLNPSTITITTDEGDMYTFGGDISSLEWTYPSVDGGSLTCTGGVINAWHLKTIQTHNGRTITFNYEPQIMSVLTGGSMVTGIPDRSIDYVYEKVYYHEVDGTTPNLGCGQESIGNAGHTLTYSLVKPVYLYSIVTPTTEIDFSYSQKANDFYGTGVLVAHNKTSQLDKIQIKDADGNPIKNITLEYNALGNTTVGYRNFLHKVDFQDAYSNTISSYQFGYNNTTNLPNPLTRGVDLWGYYNGHDENATLVPTSNSGPPNFDVTFTGREAEPSYSSIGLLQTVTYPTGGSSQFTYEGHQYAKVLRKTVAGGLTPQWFVENGNAGGVRIQSITSSDGVTRSFYYLQNYDPNDPNRNNLPSSGIFTDHDIFFLDAQWPSSNGCGLVVNSVIQDNNISASASFAETPIGYSEVSEVVTGGGYTKYFFSTKETNPDVYNLGPSSVALAPASGDNSTTNFFGQMERLLKYSSCDLERGKLLKTQVYKNENGVSTLVREIDNTYNTDPNRRNESVIGFNDPYIGGPFAIYQSYALYYYQNNITQQTTTDYTSSGSVSTTVNYSYIDNANPLVRSQSQVDSKGNTKSVNYTYPGDLSGTAPYTTMVNKNMLSSVVQEDTYKNSANLLTSTKTNYNFWTGTSWDITSTGSLILPQNVQTKTLNQSSYDTRFGYDAYDGQGNVTAYSKPGDVERCRVWGYHELYPIAEVVGASPAQVAYTSFEDGEYGGWTVATGSTINSGNAFTGKKTCSGSISKDVPLGNYIVTLWSNTAATTHLVNGTGGTAGPVRGGWQLYTYVINNASHIAVSVDNADELRLYPAGAQMTTYTYDLLIGVTSKTDVNNRTTYFQYDPFGRLFSIKDQDGNILKKFCYNFAGQQEVCNFYPSAAIDNDYLSQSCDPATQYPVAYHVSVPQGKFVSYVDQPTADQQAQQYAQGLANQNGTCAISPISVYCEDEDGAHFTIQLHNVLSQEDYWIDVDGHSDATIDVPPGAYNIIFNPSTNGWFNFFVCSGYSDAGPTMEFDDVDINQGCSTITIE